MSKIHTWLGHMSVEVSGWKVSDTIHGSAIAPWQRGLEEPPQINHRVMLELFASIPGDSKGPDWSAIQEQIRALVAGHNGRDERLAQAEAARTEAIKEAVKYAREAGSWQGIAEGKDAVISELEREVARLRGFAELVLRGCRSGHIRSQPMLDMSGDGAEAPVLSLADRALAVLTRGHA